MNGIARLIGMSASSIIAIPSWESDRREGRIGMVVEWRSAGVLRPVLTLLCDGSKKRITRSHLGSLFLQCMVCRCPSLRQRLKWSSSPGLQSRSTSFPTGLIVGATTTSSNVSELPVETNSLTGVMSRYTLCQTMCMLRLSESFGLGRWIIGLSCTDRAYSLLLSQHPGQGLVGSVAPIECTIYTVVFTFLGACRDSPIGLTRPYDCLCRNG